MALKNRKVKKNNQQGQAMTEYLLMISMIVGFYGILVKALVSFRFEEKISKTLLAPYAAAYRYGHPKARGFDEGSPRFHPRIDEVGNENFRLFLNPKFQ